MDHYNDVTMSVIASQITSLTIVYSTVYSGADQRNIKAPRHWPLCGEFTGTGEFPAQRASYAENVSIWWRHHDVIAGEISKLRWRILFLPLKDDINFNWWICCNSSWLGDDIWRHGCCQTLAQVMACRLFDTWNNVGLLWFENLKHILI